MQLASWLNNWLVHDCKLMFLTKVMKSTLKNHNLLFFESFLAYLFLLLFIMAKATSLKSAKLKFLIRSKCFFHVQRRELYLVLSELVQQINFKFQKDL